MTMNTAGYITFTDISNEFGGNSQESINLSEYYAGVKYVESGVEVGTAGIGNIPSSGVINLKYFYGVTQNTKAISIYNVQSNGTQYVVPVGVSNIIVKMWGAGGGGGSGAQTQGAQDAHGGFGGTGGFLETVLAVTPGETLTLYIGGGGISANAHAGGLYYKPAGGGGGGYTAIWRGAAPLAVVGAGGGGGGSFSGGQGIISFGGAGGNTIQGGNGSGYTVTPGGSAGRGDGGGAAGGGDATPGAANTGGGGGGTRDSATGHGSANGGFLWGNVGGMGGGTYYAAGGGGGAGYFGGGGGDYSSLPNQPGAGGGGGASYSVGANTRSESGNNDVTTQRTQQSPYISPGVTNVFFTIAGPANTGDPFCGYYYQERTGASGTGAVANSYTVDDDVYDQSFGGFNGGNGKIIIINNHKFNKNGISNVVFTTNGTYTVPTNYNALVFELYGGGGAGGCCEISAGSANNKGTFAAAGSQTSISWSSGSASANGGGGGENNNNQNGLYGRGGIGGANSSNGSAIVYGRFYPIIDKWEATLSANGTSGYAGDKSNPRISGFGGSSLLTTGTWGVGLYAICNTAITNPSANGHGGTGYNSDTSAKPGAGFAGGGGGGGDYYASGFSLYYGGGGGSGGYCRKIFLKGELSGNVDIEIGNGGPGAAPGYIGGGANVWGGPGAVTVTMF